MHQQIGKMNKSANSVFITVTLLLIQASLILGQNGEKSVDLVMPGIGLMMVSKSENLLNALHVNKINRKIFLLLYSFQNCTQTSKKSQKKNLCEKLVKMLGFCQN